MERRQISREIYENVIKDIPKELIDVLPETPEKLLKYATRVKEVQFSGNIKEEVKELMKEKLLSDEEYLKTFFYVMAITFYEKKSVANPKISIVMAQTGSGKSNLTAKLLREDSNTIFIDSDKYKHFRFDAKKIAKEYQVLYPYLTGPDAYDHADNIYQYALNNKYNIIKETAPSLKKGLLDINTNELKNKGYEIFVHVLAVGKLNSLLSIHERYELQIKYGLKTAKLTGIERHDESYEALIPNVKELLNSNIINEINIYSRGIKQEGYTPRKVYPSEEYADPIYAIDSIREADNKNTIKEFDERYKLILNQMKERNAPEEHYRQIMQVVDQKENKS